MPKGSFAEFSHGIVVILLARTHKGSAIGFVLFLACTTEGWTNWAGRLVGRLKTFRFLASPWNNLLW
jgi:hypothetical protein